MLAPARYAKCFLPLLMLAGLSFAARAADTTPPAAPAATPASTDAAVPTPAAMAAADRILGDIGIKQSIALVVPGMMTELEHNLTTTRPEIKDSLRETLRAIQPEFDKTAQQTFSEVTASLASLFSEKEIVDLAAFFDSPLGKKYVATEPVFLQKLSSVAEPWRDKLSSDILTKAREEMKKKGIEF